MGLRPWHVHVIRYDSLALRMLHECLSLLDVVFLTRCQKETLSNTTSSG